MKVFEYSDYRAYLKKILHLKTDQRGYQGMLAKAAGCQPSFFSQMLNGDVQLTPDHAANLSHFLKLSNEEREYFVTLVIENRAASRELKNMCKDTLEKLRKANADLSKRFGNNPQITQVDESVYYSSWILSAIHMCIAVPALQTVEAIGARLELNTGVVEKSLSTLESMGFAERIDKEKWRITRKSIHLPRHSPFYRMHHLNWRLHGVNKAQQNFEDGVHYTSVFAISKKDVARIEEVIRECIEKSRKIIEPSPEEELICFSCDLFRV